MSCSTGKLIAPLLSDVTTANVHDSNHESSCFEHSGVCADDTRQDNCGLEMIKFKVLDV